MPDFEERQQFRRWWLVGLLGVVAVGSWTPLVVRVLADPAEPVDPLWVVIVTGFFGGAVLPGWLLYLQLHVVVDEAGVHVRFRGLPIDRLIPFGSIVRFEALTYRPIAEYGGWGVRWRARGKIAYSVSGSRGVRMELNDGKEVLVGSQRADELAAAIRLRARR